MRFTNKRRYVSACIGILINGTSGIILWLHLYPIWHHIWHCAVKLIYVTSELSLKHASSTKWEHIVQSWRNTKEIKEHIVQSWRNTKEIDTLYLELWLADTSKHFHNSIPTEIRVLSARNYRPCFRENQPKRSFSIKWKRAFWACFCENRVYKFGHSTHLEFLYLWFKGLQLVLKVNKIKKKIIIRLIWFIPI